MAGESGKAFWAHWRPRKLILALMVSPKWASSTPLSPHFRWRCFLHMRWRGGLNCSMAFYLLPGINRMRYREGAYLGGTQVA